METNNNGKTANSSPWNFEAIALIGAVAICLLIYLSLIAVMLFSTSKVAKAPLPPASQIDSLKR